MYYVHYRFVEKTVVWILVFLVGAIKEAVTKSTVINTPETTPEVGSWA